MKTKTLLIATTLAALGLMATACKPKVTDTGIRYVAVKDGLNMREEPSPTGKKMLTIPYRQEVQKLEEKPESFTIDKTEGKWTKVSWKGKTGWVFGGFLSATAPDSPATQNTSTGGNAADCEKECEETLKQSLRFCDDDYDQSRAATERREKYYDECKTTAGDKNENCMRNCS